MLDYTMSKMKSILFGNGVNLTLADFPTWKKLLDDIHPDIDTTNTLQYENIYVQTINGGWFDDGSRLPEYHLKEKIAQKLREERWVKAARNSQVYKALKDSRVDHFLTTNYENYLLDLYGKKNVGKSKNNTEKLYSIRRSYDLRGGIKQYWPIHSEYCYPQTIMLGMDQYGGYLGKIDSWVKGNYAKLPPQSTDSHGMNNMAARLRLEDDLKIPYSWVDLFFMSELHIIGLGLSYDEIDLWWLLTYRKRLKQKVNFENHIVYHEPVISDRDLKDKTGKHEMLRALDVEVDKKEITSRDFVKYYTDTILEI